MGLDQALRASRSLSSGASPGRTSTSPSKSPSAAEPGRGRVAGSARLGLDGGLPLARRARPRAGRVTSTSRSGASRARPRRASPRAGAGQQRMELLRALGLHPRSEAGCHDECCERRGHEGMAGAGGFEPPVTGPKPAALPLGYAPSRAHRIRSSPADHEEGEATKTAAASRARTMTTLASATNGNEHGQQPGRWPPRPEIWRTHMNGATSARRGNRRGTTTAAHAGRDVPADHAGDDERGLDERDDAGEPQPVAAQPDAGAPFAVLDHGEGGHGSNHLDRPGDPDLGEVTERGGGQLGRGEIGEEPVDRRPGAAQVGAERARLAELGERARAGRRGRGRSAAARPGLPRRAPRRARRGARRTRPGRPRSSKRRNTSPVDGFSAPFGTATTIA